MTWLPLHLLRWYVVQDQIERLPDCRYCGTGGGCAVHVKARKRWGRR